MQKVSRIADNGWNNHKNVGNQHLRIDDKDAMNQISVAPSLLCRVESTPYGDLSDELVLIWNSTRKPQQLFLLTHVHTKWSI